MIAAAAAGGHTSAVSLRSGIRRTLAIRVRAYAATPSALTDIPIATPSSPNTANAPVNTTVRAKEIPCMRANMSVRAIAFHASLAIESSARAAQYTPNAMVA